MTAPVPQDYLLGEQQTNLRTNSEYAASPIFLASHEWTSKGSADILATTEDVNSLDPGLTPAPTRIRIVGQVLANPRLLKLKNLGNYNDRFFPMSESKWVVHLRKPTGTVFEHDWNLALHNLQALEQRVATSKGANMLVYGPQDALKDLRTTAPCFVPNVRDAKDPALVAYIPKVDKRFREELEELNPWWMLNVIQMVSMKGQKLRPGNPQEMSLHESLVELSFTIKHNFIKSSTTDSFSAIMSAVRVMVPGLHYSDAMTDTATVPPAAATNTAIVHVPVTVPSVPIATSINGSAVDATATLATAAAMPGTSGAEVHVEAEVSPPTQPEVVSVVTAMATVETTKGVTEEKSNGELNARPGVLFFPSMSVHWLTWSFQPCHLNPCHPKLPAIQSTANENVNENGNVKENEGGRGKRKSTEPVVAAVKKIRM
ncbi:uncharacterized protein ARMOST_08446 [Armillaria ostoyae]|uniref:Uncharacterized protein n=1 Tax=Armillaria ostoyae TaxID=47428 RepID=A0A284R8P1_ARMOS|nr:uncharacterized protein ARMOST_08446 [Armillaria ostoyae]